MIMERLWPFTFLACSPTLTLLGPNLARSIGRVLNKKGFGGCVAAPDEALRGVAFVGSGIGPWLFPDTARRGNSSPNVVLRGCESRRMGSADVACVVPVPFVTKGSSPVGTCRTLRSLVRRDLVWANLVLVAKLSRAPNGARLARLSSWILVPVFAVEETRDRRLSAGLLLPRLLGEVRAAGTATSGIMEYRLSASSSSDGFSGCVDSLVALAVDGLRVGDAFTLGEKRSRTELLMELQQLSPGDPGMPTRLCLFHDDIWSR